MRFHFSFLIELLLLVLPLRVSAADVAYEEHLLYTQGQLPVSAIHSIYRDREGYLWYGTVNGLCRDDGYNLQVFRPDFLQAQDKVVGAMVEDNDMHLWLGADNGLFWLDKRNYSITPLCPEHWEGERISNILPATGNRFWLRGRDYVALVDSLGQPIHKYFRKDAEGQRVSISAIAEMDGQIYVSFYDHTFARLEESSGEWVYFDSPEPQDEIAYICNDRRQGGLWFLYSRGSIYHGFPQGEGFHFQYFEADEKSEYYSYGLVQSPYNGVLWAMNSFGLRGYMPQDDLKLHTVYSSMTETPSYHMLANTLSDSLFTFVAAFDRPSYMLKPQTSSFTHIPLPEVTERLSFAPTVMALAEDEDGWMWFFQERTGLCLIHPETHRVVLWKDCPQARTFGLNKGRIITPSTRGFWVNHDDRMVVYRVEREGASMKVLAELDLREQSQPGEIVSLLFEDSNRRLWIGTNMGLYVYQANPLMPLAKYPKLGYVSDIVEDKQGHLWIATLEGLLCEFRDHEQWDTKLNVEPLSALSFMNDGLLWIGTQAGHIFKYNVRTGEIEDNSEACGMNGDRVNQLVPDSYGHLWIETNQRIIEYNPRNKASHIYSTEDAEIPMGRFLPTAVMTDRQGRVCFGGIPGIICFEPNNQLDSESQPVMTYITDVSVMKRSLLFDDCQLGPDNVVELKSDDRDLEIFFSSLDHYNVRQVRYAYRLIGVDKDWKYTVGGENSAFYNQLAKGNYIFEVKATDGNGLWSEHVAQLKIHRLPAFYESTIAYVCYAILFVAALLGLILGVHRRDKKQNEQMWSDSQEMLQMRNYLRDEKPASNLGEDRLPESEYRQLDQAFVQKLDQAIQKHLSESDFGVEELASAVNVSKSTLSRKLKSITGQSPLDYIRQKKMRQACLWLQDKDRNVTEIAIALGYSDRKYFTSCFKKEFGQTPTDYRREKYGFRADEEN